MIKRINASDLEIVQGDITEMDVEAIVNPANSMLKLGAGVAGAIARKGGPLIQAECDRIGGCERGRAAITGAGELACRHVIHAVGPRQGDGDEEETISSAAESVFDICAKKGIQSVAFPAISTGVFGVPMEVCAGALLRTIVARLGQDGAPARVVVCLADFRALSAFEEALPAAMKG